MGMYSMIWNHWILVISCRTAGFWFYDIEVLDSDSMIELLDSDFYVIDLLILWYGTVGFWFYDTELLDPDSII
jgi:hypothetical protein